MWSDGVALQFKAARPFYFVARYGGLAEMGMSWFFFGSGHDKGEHDGAGAVVKRTLTHEQLKPNGAILRCAQKMWLLFVDPTSRREHLHHIHQKKGNVPVCSGRF